MVISIDLEESSAFQDVTGKSQDLFMKLHKPRDERKLIFSTLESIKQDLGRIGQ